MEIGPILRSGNKRPILPGRSTGSCFTKNRIDSVGGAGEIYQLLREGLAAGMCVASIEQVDGELAAIRHAQHRRGKRLVLIQVDAVAVDLAFVSQYLAIEQAAVNG